MYGCVGTLVSGGRGDGDATWHLDARDSARRDHCGGRIAVTVGSPRRPVLPAAKTKQKSPRQFTLTNPLCNKYRFIRHVDFGLRAYCPLGIHTGLIIGFGILYCCACSVRRDPCRESEYGCHFRSFFKKEKTEAKIQNVVENKKRSRVFWCAAVGQKRTNWRYKVRLVPFVRRILYQGRKKRDGGWDVTQTGDGTWPSEAAQTASQFEASYTRNCCDVSIPIRIGPACLLLY
jgi:hypothetical protein